MMLRWYSDGHQMMLRGCSECGQGMLRLCSEDAQMVVRGCSGGVQRMHRLSSEVAQMVLMMLRGFSDNALSVLRG